jgi:hypothetical protein
MRIQSGILVSSLAASAVGSALHAQTPRTYSFIQQNSMTVPNVTVKVYRDGSRELIDQSRPPSAAPPKGMHAVTLYDFQAHTTYTWDLIDSSIPCNVAAYDKSEAPAGYDVISGAAENAAEIRKLRPNTVGTETVNGIPATVQEVADSSGQGRLRLWTAVKGGYLIKWVGLPGTGAPLVKLEVRQLRFEKPPAAVFTVPSKCSSPPP